MVIYYMIVALVLSLLNMAILIYVSPKRTSSYYTTMFYVISVQIAGHLFLSLSESEAEALLANKIAYVGAVFIPHLFFLGELTICNIKISKRLRIGLFSLSLVIFGLALTTGYSTIFYKSITLVQRNGVTDFDPEFGPAHMLFNAVLGLYLVSGICVLVYSLLKKKNVSYKNLMGLAAMGFISIGAFFVLREMGMDMLVMPAIYLMVEYVMIAIIHRIGKYDIEGTIRDTLEFQNENAYLSVTKDFNYIGCNDIALHNFPELRYFRVDTKIQENTELGHTLLKLLRKFNPQELSLVENFKYGKNYYKAILRNLHHGDKVCGYIFRIEDETKMQRYIKLLDKYNSDLANEVQMKDEYIRNIQEQMIAGMANMVESREQSASGHTRRTSNVVKILANEIKRSGAYPSMTSFFNAVIKAAPIHDLGKIAVEDAVLRKPGKFEPGEFEQMKTHSEKGATIVENLLKDVESEQLVKIAQNVAHYHHERWDGTGYPERLKGEQIPLEARIMAIADVYDALVSRRSYKEKKSHAEAFDIIVNSMGTHFDPNLKMAFINCHKELEAFYDSCGE
ncbi:MAG: HD domain-containing protein [Fibrobacter sp.]|nr:HD domain-containing protein [Fibrobacter sp.]